MPFKNDQAVSFHYTLTNQDGQLVESSRDNVPLSFLAGRAQILPKLEEELSQMEINEKRTVTLPPADAYGEFRDDAIQHASRDDFPPDTELEIGMQFWASMEDGQQVPFVIKEIGENDVTIDFNHPLAGQTLTFEMELMEIRPATEEELAHGHIHGEGGHQH
jgi:FKBP-type peptidyl-prolyl cis-trans isomerase SlyD